MLLSVSPNGGDVIPGSVRMVLIDIGYIEDRLGGDESVGTNDLGFRGIQLECSQGLLGIETGLASFQHLGTELDFLVAGTRLTPGLFQGSLHLFEIGKQQLDSDDLDIANRIHRARHMDDVVVLETAGHLKERIDFPDVGQELVAQPLALVDLPRDPRYPPDEGRRE